MSAKKRMTIFSASLLPNSFFSATTSFPSRNPRLTFSGSLHFSGRISVNHHHHRSITMTASSSSSEHIPPLISVFEESLLKHDAVCNRAMASLLAKQYVAEAKLPSDPNFWSEEAIDAIIAQITRLQVALVTLAVKNEGVIVIAIDPDLNRGQPVLLANLLLAYVEQLDRDVRRHVDCRKRLTRSTFGVTSGVALGQAADNQLSETTTYLGLLSAISIMAMHLSRIRSQWVTWSSDNFGFITSSEPVLTGQLDDVLEDVLALQTTFSNALRTSGKELKEFVFGSVKTVIGTLEILSNFARNIQYNKDIILKKGLPAGYDAATLAEYLVLKGIPVGTTNEIVERAVAMCDWKECQLQDLTLDEFRSFSSVFDADVYEYIGIENCIAKLSSYGSTGPWSVAAQLDFWIKNLNIDVSPSFSVVSDRKGDKDEPDGPSGPESVMIN